MIIMSGFKQASHVFVPGKNWKLSLAELVSFLEARGCKFTVTGFSHAFVAVAFEDGLDPSVIDSLGGFLKVGRVVSSVPLEVVEDAFLYRKRDAQSGVESILSADSVVSRVFREPLKKCVFGVSVYFEDRRFLRFSREMQRFLGSYFKEELAVQGIKARFLGFPKRRKLPQLTHVEVLKMELVGKSAEILFCVGKERVFVAETVAVHDPFEFQKRDVGRPVQRRIFSMPPRLALIMVNLSSCLRGKVLLDPFCGVGGVLQEALLMKACVVGVDVDPWCVKASGTNLEWLKREYALGNGEYRVLVGDARCLADQVEEESVDCVVTEPDLGPALRHFPTEFYAKKIFERLRPLYVGFLGEAYKVLKPGGKVVFVSPYIRTRKGSFMSLDIDERVRALGFRMVYPFSKFHFEEGLLAEDMMRTSSLVDMEERHKIGREIRVLQK